MDRLNKFLAHAGLGSRRHCEALIRGGRVSIDGRVVTNLATRVAPEQDVKLDGEPIRSEKHVYWLVNKPRGFLCTNHDPSRRPLAIDLVPQINQRVYTVGRLDEDSEGLLLLTNDGDLANCLMHPRYGVEKSYLVLVAGNPSPDDIKKLLQGVYLAEGQVKARNVKRLKRQGNAVWLRIVLSEGKNREIRRMLAKLDHKVLRLKRIEIGPLEIGKLATGKSRPLTPQELKSLQRLAEKTKRVEEANEPRPSGSGEPASPTAP